MIIHRLDSDWPRQCDVCVVGAGPVGLAVAHHLDELGRRVLLLEAGGMQSVAGLAGVSEVDVVNPRTHAAGHEIARQGLGGTGSAWGGGCQRFGDAELSGRPYVGAPSMPAGTGSLEPDYRSACSFLGVEPDAVQRDAATAADQCCAGVDSRALIQIPRQRDPSVRHRARIANSQTLVVCLHVRVVALQLAPGSGKIAGLEVLNAGRRMTLAPPIVVLACGGMQCARLLLLARREHPLLLGGEDGPLGRYYMGHLTGSIARISFSAPELAEHFKPRSEADGSISRSVMTLGAQTQAAHGLSSAYFIPRNFPLGDPGYRHGALSAIHLALTLRHLTPHYMRSVPGEFDFGVELVAHLANILHAPLETVAGVIALLVQRRAGATAGLHIATSSGIYALGYHAEQVPAAESRVTLSSACDATGVPLPRADLRYADRDIEGVLSSHELLSEALSRAGAARLVWRAPAESRAAHVRAQAGDGYHQMGLTRLSGSPRDGVVDHDLAVHGVANLFVASCGVLPVSSYAHPTLTAVALGIRLARHLAAPPKLVSGAVAGVGAAQSAPHP